MSEITINPVTGLHSVDGVPLTPEQHEELCNKLRPLIQEEIDNELLNAISKQKD